MINNIHVRSYFTGEIKCRRQTGVMFKCPVPTCTSKEIAEITVNVHKNPPVWVHRRGRQIPV